eukprot:SAG11_NODE_721_length_7539_cov_32.292473_5_plen_66_part_00
MLNTKISKFSHDRLRDLNSEFRSLVHTNGTMYRYGTQVYLHCSRDLLSDRGTKFSRILSLSLSDW